MPRFIRWRPSWWPDEGKSAGIVSALGIGAGTPLRPIFRQDVITNVLDPKVVVFFLAVLPQFVDPARGSPALQVIALGLLFDVTGTLVNLAVAMGSSRAAERLRTPSRGGALLQRMKGVIFVALELKLALASPP